MRRTVVLLALCFAALPFGSQAQAQDPAARPDVTSAEQRLCAHADCQRNLHVVLKKKDGTAYDETFAVFPATVQGFGVSVVAGQAIHLEANVDGGKVIGYRAVERIADPAITITVKLEQMVDGGMMLSLHNPFGKALKFEMGIMPLDSDGLYRTSSCPIIADGDSFEMWPYPIFQVVLGNGRLLEPGDSMACVE
jgi:hypothetical protein